MNNVARRPDIVINDPIPGELRWVRHTEKISAMYRMGWPDVNVTEGRVRVPTETPVIVLEERDGMFVRVLTVMGVLWMIDTALNIESPW